MKEIKKITLSLGLGALLMGSSAFGALAFTPPETLSNDGLIDGSGSAFKTKLVRMGNGLLISVYGDANGPDVYDLKADTVRKARDIYERHCMPSVANDQCKLQSSWSDPVNISNTAGLTSISTKWKETSPGILSTTTDAYFGDSEKPNIFNSGTFAVISWVDKYCGNDSTSGSEQRMISYNERGGITVPFSCVYVARANFADLSNVTWTKTQLTSGIRDAKQDVNKGVSSADKKGQWVVTWQEDPHGLQIGGGDGPGEGASGANVTHGTDIWYTYTENLMANGFNTPRVRISDNFTEVGKGGNTSPIYAHDGVTLLEELERGNTGASRANTAMVNVTTGETVPTVLITYEETKGADRLDNGKFIRYHSFTFNSPPNATSDMSDPNAIKGEPGAIISDPTENSRRVRFVTQVKPATNGLRMGVFWRQGHPVEGGPGDIMVRLGFKTTNTSSSGLRPEDMLPPVDAVNARESDYFKVASTLNNTPAYNISSNTTPWSPVGGAELAPTNTLVDATDKNNYEDARAHRAAIRGEDFYIGYSYTKDWAVATYTDMDNYNFWVRSYNSDTGSWSAAANLSGITDKKIHVKEPRLVGMPGNGPGCTDSANITNRENCQDKSIFLVAWGVETNVYAHAGGSEEGDIYYTRTNDKGSTYTDPSVVEGKGTSNRFESQLRSTPAGNTIFTVWNEANNAVGGLYSQLSVSTSNSGTATPPPTGDSDSSAEVTPPITSTSKSGGGCTYNPDSKSFDMIFFFMMALGLLYPFKRRFIS